MFIATQPPCNFEGLGLSISFRGVVKKARKVAKKTVRVVTRPKKTFKALTSLTKWRKAYIGIPSVGIAPKITRRRNKLYKERTTETAKEMEQAGRSTTDIARYRRDRNKKRTHRRKKTQRQTRVAAAVAAVAVGGYFLAPVLTGISGTPLAKAGLAVVTGGKLLVKGASTAAAVTSTVATASSLISGGPARTGATLKGNPGEVELNAYEQELIAQEVVRREQAIQRSQQKAALTGNWALPALILGGGALVSIFIL